MPNNDSKLKVFEVLTLLRPYDIDVEKIRVGPRQDGGYIVANKFAPSQVVLSYGIGSQTEFDHHLASLGHTVYMFDHTIDAPKLTLPNMHFVKEGIGIYDGDLVKTLDTHLTKIGTPAVEHAVLKLDVEGAEWDVIPTWSQMTLRRFDQITMEVHGLDWLATPAVQDKVKAALTNIDKQFTLFHVHANNYVPLTVVEGFAICGCLELSFIRSSLVNRQPSKSLFPTSLDWPNNPATNDHLLWFYPFLPSSVSTEAFASSLCRGE
jgi:hypothetical protein